MVCQAGSGLPHPQHAEAGRRWRDWPRGRRSGRGRPRPSDPSRSLRTQRATPRPHAQASESLQTPCPVDTTIDRLTESGHHTPTVPAADRLRQDLAPVFPTHIKVPRPDHPQENAALNDCRHSPEGREHLTYAGSDRERPCGEEFDPARAHALPRRGATGPGVTRGLVRECDRRATPPGQPPGSRSRRGFLPSHDADHNARSACPDAGRPTPDTGGCRGAVWCQQAVAPRPCRRHRRSSAALPQDRAVQRAACWPCSLYASRSSQSVERSVIGWSEACTRMVKPQAGPAEAGNERTRLGRALPRAISQ